MAIIVTKQGKNAKKIDKSEFEYEDNLQQYIDDNPESIPLYEIKEDIRVLVLCREFNTNSGPIDALGIDRDGDIYIIETKLFKNQDKRRVVAQALDYGASLWKSTIDFGAFLQQVDAHLAKKDSPNTPQRIGEFFETTEDEVDAILAQIRDNLNHGNFKFIILMDELDSRLKDLILFVNENSKFDIYAVEFEYYKHEDFEIVIPKLFGAQVRKDPPPRPSKMNEVEFIRLAEGTDLKTAERLQVLLDLGHQAPFSYYWGTKNLSWGFSVDDSFIKLFEISYDGTFFVNFSRGEVRERLRSTLFADIDKLFRLDGAQDVQTRKFKLASKGLGDVTDKEFAGFVTALKGIG